jgi:hypothetical protein
MALKKISGSRLYIGTRVQYKTTVATADFSGMTWTQVKGWTTTGDLGSEQAGLSQALVDEAITLYGKGVISFPMMTNQFVPDYADPGQNAFRVAQASCKPYAFKVEWDADCGSESEVTISNATPGVVTWTAHGLANGTPIILSTTGTLPTGLLPGVIYYVVDQATNTFELAATPGGASINTSSIGTGTHTARALVPNETDLFFGLAMRGTKTGGDAGANRFVNFPIQPISAAIPV